MIRLSANIEALPRLDLKPELQASVQAWRVQDLSDLDSLIVSKRFDVLSSVRLAVARS